MVSQWNHGRGEPPVPSPATKRSPVSPAHDSPDPEPLPARRNTRQNVSLGEPEKLAIGDVVLAYYKGQTNREKLVGTIIDTSGAAFSLYTVRYKKDGEEEVGVPRSMITLAQEQLLNSSPDC
jgi:hypothetical protein